MPPNKTLLAAFALFLLLAPARAQAGEDWGSCATDSDCVVVGAGCATAAVNKQFRAEADKYYKAENTTKDCSTPVAPAMQHAQCAFGRGACRKPDGSVDPASTCAVKQCRLVK